MRVGLSIAGASFVAACSLFLVNVARGQETPLLGIVVDYDAHQRCPPRAVFVGNVLARTPRARLTNGSSSAMQFAVRITEADSVSVGTMVVKRPEGGTSTREVAADTCGEVVAALALVAALTIDPDADTAPLSDAAVESAATNAVAATAEVVEHPHPREFELEPEVPAAPSETPQTPPPPAPSPPPPAPLPPTAEARSLEVGFGVQLEAVHAPLGAPLPAFRAFWDVGSAREGVLRPLVGASFAFTTARFEGALGDANLAWLSGRLDLCPADLSRAEWLTVRPCVAFDIGVVQGWGREGGLDDFEPRTDRFLWTSGALVGRFDVVPVEPVFLRAEASLVVPFAPNSGFVFEAPDQAETVVDVPNASYALGLGAGLRF